MRSMVEGTRALPVGDAGHRSAEDLAGTSLGQRGDDVALPHGGADLLADHLH